jgi:hypothetical protein
VYFFPLVLSVDKLRSTYELNCYYYSYRKYNDLSFGQILDPMNVEAVTAEMEEILMVDRGEMVETEEVA